MKRSKAFSLGSSPCLGKIYVNHNAPLIKKGNVSFEVVRSDIVKKLQETCKDLRIQLKIYLPREIYRGDFVSFAPDILFVLNDFECTCHDRFRDGSYYQTFDHSRGEHRIDGVFIAWGSDIKSDKKMENAKIYDVAPTILHMFGAPVPDDMDGRVLTGIFRKKIKSRLRACEVQKQRRKIKNQEKIFQLKKARKI